MAIISKRNLTPSTCTSDFCRTLKLMAMTYLDVVNQFWREHEKRYFSPSEIAFYFFIANECNRKFWNMPVACPTEYVCNQLKLSKQAIINARNALAERGLLNYDKGKWGTIPPFYTICELTKKLTSSLTDGLTNDSTINKENKNIKTNTRKERKKERNSNREIKIIKDGDSKKMVSISELRELLLTDLDWQNELFGKLAEEGITFDINSLKEKLLDFFNMLENHGFKEKEEADCRQYVFYWIRKYFKTNNNEYSNRYNRRRAVEAKAASAEEYEQSF